MRKIYLLLLVLSFCGIASSQSLSDQEQIVQQCINLESLKSLYPKQGKLFIMQHGVSFGDIHLVYNKQKVSFLTKEHVTAQHPDAYFLFWTFDVGEKTARTEFVYNYGLNTPEVKEFKATVLLEKQGTTWIIKTIDQTVNNEK